MEEAVWEACRDLGRDYIDIFHLHAPEKIKMFFRKSRCPFCFSRFEKEGDN